MPTIDKITRIPLKDAFKYESKNLTPWLCENISVLGDALGIELSGAEREQTTGNFYVDLKAQNSTGETVIIENQYGSSDHDHLGKIITYASSFAAKIAIWIVETPKQEHINAIAWLNERDNGCDFYLIKIQAIKIGESNPAPLFTLISGPSEESKQIGKIKKENTHKENLRASFWEEVLSRTIKKGINVFSGVNATGRDAWLGTTAGYKGLTYVYWVNQFNTWIELRIDRGKGSEVENIKLFNEFKVHKETIDATFGAELNWDELELYRACSIRKVFDNGGYMNPTKEWDSIIENLVSGMDRLIAATKPFVSKLKI